MKSKFLITAIALFSASLVFYSCQKEVSGNSTDPNKPLPVSIYLTDHQTPVFDSVFGMDWIPYLATVHFPMPA